MGLFSNLFGKKKEEKKESKKIFYAQPDELMNEATRNAQQNFKYFWRELYWEQRRIVPAHNFAMVKFAFEQGVEGEEQPVVEHMWVNNIDFDGAFISGELVNDPSQLTNVVKGDIVNRKVSELSDWMFSIGSKTYGGFTIQAMRSEMGEEERKNHDAAWGLDFGDFNETLVVYEQKEKKENLIEHPMSKNMVEKVREFLDHYPEELTVADENGFTMLHREATAGNRNCVEILLELGADKNAKTKANKTALDYAKFMNWDHLSKVLN